MVSKNTDRWLGGYIRRGKRGAVYVIERWIDGKRYHVSTKRKTERAALAEFALFEANPGAYMPNAKSKARAGSVEITPILVDEYVAWMIAVRRCTQDHAISVGKYLAQWADALEGVDLRELGAVTLKKYLGRWKTARHYRTKSIKGFCRWLRQEKGLLSQANDPAIDLQMIKAAPAKHRRRRAATVEAVAASMNHLSGAALDAVRVLSATGMHLTELERFAASGEILPATPTQAGAVANLVIRHKSGDTHAIAISDPVTLESARRLRAAGRTPERTVLRDKIETACAKAGVTRYTPGALRHSFATWRIEEGVDPAQVARVLGHRTAVTTMRFYVDVGHSAPVLGGRLPAPTLRIVG